MKTKIELPLMNVRDVVLFPDAYQQLIVGRRFTIDSIQKAKQAHQGRIIVITQKAVQKVSPLSKSDMYSVGTVCRIEKSVMLSDGTMKVLLQGERTVSVGLVLEKDGVRFALGTFGRAKASGKKLSRDVKRQVLSLLLKWNPALALDDDEERFDTLKKETELTGFVSTVSGLISHPRPDGLFKGLNLKASPKKLGQVNLRIKKRQCLLEESSAGKRLLLIREILSEEIHSGAY